MSVLLASTALVGWIVLAWGDRIASGAPDRPERFSAPELHAERSQVSAAYRRALDANDWGRAGYAALRLAEIAIWQADFEEADQFLEDASGSFRRAQAEGESLGALLALHDLRIGCDGFSDCYRDKVELDIVTQWDSRSPQELVEAVPKALEIWSRFSLAFELPQSIRQRALRLGSEELQNGGDRLARLRLNNALLFVYDGAFETAADFEDSARRTIELAGSAPESIEATRARIALGIAQLQQGRHAEATTSLTAGLASAKSTGSLPELCGLALAALAELLRLDGQPSLARKRAEAAAECFDRVLDERALDRHLRWLGGLTLESFQSRLVEAQIDAGQPGAGFRTTEKVRARQVLRRLGHRGLWPATLPRSRRRSEHLLRSIQEKERTSMYAVGVEGRSVQDALLHSRAEYWELLDQLEQRAPGFRSWLGVGTPSATDVQQSLPANTQLVSFYFSSERGYAWVLSAEEIGVYSLPLASRLSSLRDVRCFTQASSGIRDPDNRRSRLGCGGRSDPEFLYDQIWTPIESAIRQRKLIIVPGPLQMVPFGALRNPVTGRYLLEDHLLTRVPYAGALRRPIATRRAGGVVSATVFGEPLETPWWLDTENTLPGLAQRMGKLLGCLAFLGEAATESRFRESGVQFDLLHLELPTLARETPVDVTGAHLFLSPDEVHNGRVTASEIAGLDLSATRLATLPPALSWDGRRLADESGELGIALFRAGVHAVLLRLWQTNADAESRFLAELYRRLRNGLPAAEALRETQLSSLARPQPGDSEAWAAFTLLGLPEGKRPDPRVDSVMEPVEPNSTEVGQEPTAPSQELPEASRELLRIQTLSALATRSLDDGSPYLAMLQAVEALKRAQTRSLPSPNALEALRTAFRMSSGRGLQRPSGSRVEMPSGSAPPPPPGTIGAVRAPPPGKVRGLAFSDDGQCLAVGSADGTLDSWRFARDEGWFRSDIAWQLPAGVSALAISGDCRWLAAAGFDGDVRLASLSPGFKRPFVSLHTGRSGIESELRFTDDGKHLLAETGPAVVEWQLEPEVKRKGLYARGDPSPVTAQRSQEEQILSRVFGSEATKLPDTYSVHLGQGLLAVSDPDGTIRVWGLGASSITEPTYLPGHRMGVVGMAFSPTGSALASGGLDRTVRLWDLRPEEHSMGGQVFRLDGVPTSLAFSPDGVWLAAGTSINTVRLWRRDRANLTEPLVIDDGTPIQMAKLLFEGRWLLTNDANGRMRLWDLRSTPAPTSRLLAHRPAGPALAMAVSSSDDSTWWAIPGIDDSLQIWRFSAAGEADKVLDLRGVQQYSLDPGGRWLATRETRYAVRVYDLESRTVIATLPVLIKRPESSVALDFHPSGSLLVGDLLWNLAAARGRDAEALAPTRLRGVPYSFGRREAKFSPDGQWLVSHCRENAVCISKVSGGATLQSVRTVAQTKFAPRSPPVFSGDSRWLAVDGQDHRSARVLRLTPAAGEERLLLLPRETQMASFQLLTASSDGRWLASVGLGAEPFLWDLKKPHPGGSAMRIPGHRVLPFLDEILEMDIGAGLPDLSFSFDGRRLAVSDLEGRVHIWRLDDSELIDLACGVVGRNLSAEEWQRSLQPPAPYRCTCPHLPPGLGGPEVCPDS